MKSWAAPAIIAAFGLFVLCGLGFWQLARLEWKESLIHSLQSQMDTEPVLINAETSMPASGTPAKAIGVLEEEYFDILSGSDQSGVGYRRVYPLQGGDARIMVEVGFVPEGDKAKPIELPEGEIEIDGHIFVPENGEGSYDPSRNIWVGYDLEQMAVQLDAEPFILVASQAPIEGVEDAPMTIDLPNNHLQYAITWFSLAVIWLAMAIYWGIHRQKEEIG